MKYAKIVCILCLFICCFSTLTSAAQGSAASSAPIFTEMPLEMDRAESARAKTASIRERFVSVDFAVLIEPDILPGEEFRKELLLNLFDDTSVTAVIDQIIHNPSGSRTWTGHLHDLELSEIVMILKDQMMVANISYEGRFYQIRYVDGELHVVSEIDQTQFPAELDPVPVDLPEPDESVALLADGVPMEGDDSGAVIDIMVVYTDDARAAEGGTAEMEALIELAVAETNTGYMNSGINHRLNLVHTAEISYDETSFNWSTTLSRLQNGSDGYMDEVHSLRDSYGADEVALIVEGDGVYCGLGYLMTSVSSSFAGYAFYEVSRECAAGTYSFGHELGHNMGARHDWYVDEETSPYSYSHGYLNRTDLWRTVMAYGTECSDQDVYCPRINYWSNPNVSYNGAPTGVAGGTSTACAEGDPNHPACDADNARTLNNTASTTAAFRSHVTHRLEYDSTGTIIDKNKTSIWHPLAFSEDFGNAPVFVADIQTNWGGETAELRMQNLTASSVEMKLEEDKSADNENNHLAEDVGYLALTPGLIENAAGDVIGEAGSLQGKTSEDSDWDSLTFQRSYTNPVVRMQMVTFSGAAPSHVRLRNVSANGLEFQLEEWDHDDQFHGWETVNYVVLEAGDHTLPNNVRLVADTVDISADGSGLFTKVLFSPVFADMPIVLSQSQSYNDPAAIVTRQKDIRANRVKIRLVEEEAADQVHGSETVGYIAIGALAAGDKLLGADLYPDTLALAELEMSPDVLESTSLDLLENPALTKRVRSAEPYSTVSAGKTAEQNVPEPSTLVLLVMGLLGVSGMWRNWRRK